jgi:serine/threonine-protein kinase
MSDPRTSRFWVAGLQSGLIDQAGLVSCYEAIPPEKREAVEHLDRRLARQAVQLNLLTLWQAQQLLVGRTNGFKVGRYVLVDLIGHGGMGRVYLAKDSRLNRMVALKILAPERMNNPRAIARFQREGRVGAQLQHENLVRIYDFGESNGRYYLVMEYIEGRTIGSLIAEQGPMPPPTAARLGRQIALGLEHAYKKDLIHRDVNPYNILVTHDGTAKLTDLGLAIDLGDNERVTRDGATVGTFDYVAPEQARHSHSVDIRSDIYSLGCTLHHMISGQVPFPTPSLPEKLYSHQALEPPLLNQLVPGVPEGLAEVVRWMMRKSPEDRPATPLIVAQALEPYLDEPPGGGDSSPIATQSPRQSARQSPAARTVAIPRLSTGLGVPPPSVSGSSVDPPPFGGSSDLSVPAGAGAGAAPAPASAAAAAIPGASTGAGVGTVAGIGSPPSGRLVSSPQDSEEIDPSVQLILDLGPEPSLSDMIGPAKPYPAGTPSWWFPALAQPQENRTWLWVLLVMAIAVAVASVSLAVAGWMGWGRAGRGGLPPKSRASADGSTTRRRGDGRRTQPGSTDSTVNAAIVVRTDVDGRSDRAVNTLADAVRAALRNRGAVVLLDDREPLHLSNESPLALNASGSLTIRARPGTRPVLEIDLPRPTSFLTAGSALNLELDGLTIIARYPSNPATPAPPTPPTPDPGLPPVITAAASATIHRCAFRAEGTGNRPGSRAIVSEGGLIDVEGSWFEGFDAAIDVRMLAGSRATIRQSMIVPSPLASAPKGWAVVAQVQPGVRPSNRKNQTGPSRQLLLDHCTMRGAGLLKLVGFSDEAPLGIEVQSCAVRTETLLSRTPDAPGGDPWAGPAVSWSGRSNRYDVPPGTSTPRDREPDARFEPIVFATDPSRMAFDTAPPGPRDFAIQPVAGGDDAQGSGSGANPSLVGPEMTQPTGDDTQGASASATAGS